MISVQESFELFIATLSRFAERNLDFNDDVLAYQIFEELDSEYHSFLHQWTVDRLIEGKFIPHSLRQRILALRENINPLMEGKHEVTLYRNDPEWQKIRDEANTILQEVQAFVNNR